MFEVQRIQAVAFREQKSPVERVGKQPLTESKIKLGALPKEVKSFFEFVPIGFQLEAYVKKATREEVILRLRFLDRELEIAVKNLLGFKFEPNQKVLLTLIDRNPYLLKLSLPLAESYKIFSQVREFFKSPLPSVLNAFLNLPSIPLLIKNSGLFYENRLVKYLLGEESTESLREDTKYKLFKIVNRLGFTKPKYQLFARPLRFVNTFASLPFRRINLELFIKAYSPFYELSPKLIETFTGFIHLTKQKLLRKFPKFAKRKNIKE